MATRRQRAAKLARAQAHTERRDTRSDGALTADQRRNVNRDERRRERKERAAG